jgi:hypothetical protein
MMVVQFNFYEQEEINSSLKSMVTILNEMYSTLLFSMNRLRLLLLCVRERELVSACVCARVCLQTPRTHTQQADEIHGKRHEADAARSDASRLQVFLKRI